MVPRGFADISKITNFNFMECFDMYYYVIRKIRVYCSIYLILTDTSQAY
jgi:hypothetical protein